MDAEDILEILNVIQETLNADPKSAFGGNVIILRRFNAFINLAKASIQVIAQ